MDHQIVATVLRELEGQRCEDVDNPFGSIIRLDIGPMGLKPGAMPSEKPHGWRHVTIQSPWRVTSSAEVLFDWNDEGGPAGHLGDSVTVLQGLTVVSARAEPPSWDLRLRFSNGLMLEVFSDSTDDREDSWFILGTDGLEVAVSPQMLNGGGGRIIRLPRMSG